MNRAAIVILERVGMLIGRWMVAPVWSIVNGIRVGALVSRNGSPLPPWPNRNRQGQS